MAKPSFFTGKYAIKGVEDAMKRAAVSALNKFAARIVVMLRKRSLAKYNISRRAFDRVVSVDRAKMGKYRVTILVDRVPISLSEFNPIKSNKGVTVEIIRGKPVEIEGAFIGTRKVGRVGSIGNLEVFQRKGKERLPIKVTTGTRIADMLRSNEMYDAIKVKYREEFADLLTSEFKFFNSKRS